MDEKKIFFITDSSLRSLFFLDLVGYEQQEVTLDFCVHLERTFLFLLMKMEIYKITLFRYHPETVVKKPSKTKNKISLSQNETVGTTTRRRVSIK